MNTFHNFSECIYTSQGKIICQKKNKPSNIPMLLENFVNINPNEKNNSCSQINNKFTDIISNYKCDTINNITNSNCLFKFKCQEIDKCQKINQKLTSIASNYTCDSTSDKTDSSCSFNFNCINK